MEKETQAICSLPADQLFPRNIPLSSFIPHRRKMMMNFMGTSHVPVLILVFLCSSSKSDDNLTHGKPLSHGETLVSRGRDFSFGFFSPANSNTSLYLGIWYHNIPDRTVVWTTNRDSPIAATSSPMLAITNSSDLVLSDSLGRTHWVAKMNNITSFGVAAVLRLRDTGNLVLRFPNSSIIWQSFEHPTDTILPGMRFSFSEKDRVVGRLVAWKDPNDPSSGDFSLSLDPNSNLQLFIWYGTRPYYRISILNDVSVSGDIYQKIISYETVGGTGNGFYYTYTVSNSSLYVRLMIDYMGVLRTLSWNNRSTWTTISERPASSYDYYASCGPFDYVDYIGNKPTCHCIDGFDPTGLNFSSGCRRTKALECGKLSHFVTIPRMKVADKFLRILNRSFEECMAECSNNCSCTAYAYTNSSINSIMADQSRCLIWTRDLVDSGKHNNNGENLYLRLAGSPVEKNRRLVKIPLPTIACVLILTCILLVRICKCRASNRRKREIQKRLMLGCLGSSNQFLGENPDFPFVSFEDIVTTTDNLSNSKQIGRGGFGKVYKGILEGFNEAAIKRLSKDSGQGLLEFKNEIVLISKLQHRNLVRLLGCCMHVDERLLIYEYLPNKSLDAFLFDPSKQYVLDWPTRLKIIKGVSRGLLYLHQDSRLTVIHRDLKASNILLDSEMTPKISDFGMARIFEGNQHQANTTRVVGTYDNMPPEYVIGGAFSMKLDTYSFGVLLLEIVSGLKISSPQLLVNFVSLTTYAWRLWQDGRATKLVHSSVIESCPLHEVLRCIHVGLLCVQERPDDRPLMPSVTFMLENEGALLLAPKQPAYSALQVCENEESRENMKDSLN